ncbi:MAG: hypothetical protein DMD67_13655, partial [Gemmatimonadetes bacterium]
MIGLEVLLYCLIALAFWALWFVVGAYAGVLWAPRGLALAAVIAGLGIAGLWLSWAGALDIMLVADLALVAAVWVDAVLAPRFEAGAVAVSRDAPPAFSVGRAAEVTYRWVNGTRRTVRLRLREVRPDLLGGTQPSRRITVPRLGEARETVAVMPVRRGREQAGEFVVDVFGPLGLGRRRGRLPVSWDAAVYPPLVSVRLRASVAQARRRREPGITPLRQIGEGRKVITRQYEAERRQQVLLVLDTGRLLTADIAGVSRLDYVVQAALELAYAAVQHDDNVGVMAFADGVQHFVAPQRGRLALKRVVDVLAVVEPRLVEPDYPGAFRYLAARNRKRALTVLFTDVIDRFASDALVANVAGLRPRHLPLAVTLKNPE